VVECIECRSIDAGVKFTSTWESFGLAYELLVLGSPDFGESFEEESLEVLGIISYDI
jgi:hypothetical protein